MLIKTVIWNIRFSTNQLEYHYNQIILEYNGRVLPCISKHEFCDATSHLRASIFLFQKNQRFHSSV